MLKWVADSIGGDKGNRRALRKLKMIMPVLKPENFKLGQSHQIFIRCKLDGSMIILAFAVMIYMNTRENLENHH